MKSERPLYVLSRWGGLCNRMQSLALLRGVFPKRQIRVEWPVTKACPGLPTEGFADLPFEWGVNFHHSFLLIGNERISTVVAEMAKHLHTEIKFALPVLQSLKPTAAIQSRLESLDKALPKHLPRIGVHVRRTDLTLHRTWDENQQEQFFKCDRQLSLHSGTVFVLAADNGNSVADFKRRYGSRVFHTGVEYQTGKLRHTTVADAIFDLFALSRTNAIVGTHWSSFSDMASRMGGIKLL